jgi:DNA-binding FadR family transcriptional regulator
VVKAILTGDPARAHTAMIHHMDLVEASFENLLYEEGQSQWLSSG